MKRLFSLCLASLLCLGLACQPHKQEASRAAPGANAISQEEQERGQCIRNSWAASSYLDGVHCGQGLACGDCHGCGSPGFDDVVESARCLACHGSRKGLAEKTGGKSARRWGNPHQSHLGDLDCNVCHKAHEASTVYCLGCHSNAPFTIPGE